ncbi:hypothetical protein Bca4012_036198 [Brassica carinata]
MSQSQWMVKSGGKKMEVAKPRLKISVPRFDNTELIARYAKTVIGRCMNPPKQDMKILLFMLPRIWQVEGRVTGSDLGLGRFQFDFETEEDIVEVLKMEPFHFDYWMVSIVRWKPVLDANYPSKITFWVRVLDVPLQFWAASTFQGVGDAIGKVQGEVDLLEGRVRVELDGFKPLVFSMEVDFAEGVELVVNLRYEKLFGFCRECCCMTHDQTRCPNLIPAVEEGALVVEPKLEQGAHVTSYKAVVSNGKETDEVYHEGLNVHSRGMKDGSKGKSIAREKHASFRQDRAYRAYKERYPRSFGEGSSRGGRNFGIGVPKEQHGRFAINPRGIQNLRHGEEGHNLSNPQKLMMDAFKGANQHPKATQVSQRTMVEDGNNSKARKSLQFDETVNAEVAGEVIEEVSVNMRQEIPTPLDGNLLIGDEVMKDLDLMEQDQSALDDANLMIEGVLLSDSELLDEEWEEGEVPEFMEEMEEMPLDVGSEKVVEAQNISEDLNEKEDHGAKASKKKGLKIGVFGGASKKRLVQNLLSPRKNKMAKAPVKNGDKGNGEGKKVLSKPKDGWAANSVCWDTEFQDGFPVIILGMNYVQETKKMVVYIGKAYMMEDSYHWLMLRFLLVTYRLRSWYDPHLLIHSFASGLMRCQDPGADIISNPNIQKV